MSVVPLLEKLIRSLPLLLAVALAGCGISADEEYYLGDEQAVREHMQEVEDEERVHFQPPQQPEGTASMFPEGRPGGT